MAEITNIIVGVILGVLVISLFSLAIADHSTKYNTTLSSKINTSINQINNQFDDLSETSTQAYNVTTTTEASQTVDTGIDPKKSLAAVKTTTNNVITITLTMLGSVSDILKIPPRATAALVVILVFVVTVTILALVFKMKP